MTGIERNMGRKILKLLESFPAVVVLGARQTGKTTLSRQLLPTWKYVDLEKPSDLERINNDAEFYFEQNPQHLIIDEAQSHTDLFKILRGVIDNDRGTNGRFVLTGSSSPELLKKTSETLAGRVAIVELGTLKANEFYNQPLSEFYNLFASKLNKKTMQLKNTNLTAEQMQNLWLHGGYPEPLIANNHTQYMLWMENYFQTYVNRDIASLFPKLNKITYRRFINMLSQMSGSIINKANLSRALEVSNPTAGEYIAIADGTFLWRELQSYENNIIKSIIKMPKGFYRDSGLLHYLLKIQNINDLFNNPMVGLSFESFVIEEIIKGLQATNLTQWQANYYRTRNGAEIDLILEGNFGVLPIEIKYGSTTKIKQLTSLISFIKEHKLPFGMVINQSKSIEWLTPEVIQIPFTYI
jgi:uncharacterized protein